MGVEPNQMQPACVVLDRPESGLATLQRFNANCIYTRVRNPYPRAQIGRFWPDILAECQKGSKWSASVAPAYAEALARLAIQKPPSRKATACQGNQVRIGQRKASNDKK